MSFQLQAELLTEIGQKQAEKFIVNPQYGVQEKANGKRRVIVRSGDSLFCFNREGEKRDVPAKLARVFLTHPLNQFVIDGELCGTVISPKYNIFDVLILGDREMAQQEYQVRERAAHDEFDDFNSMVTVLITAVTPEDKLALITRLWDEKAEGVVFKNLKATYREGRANQHFKLKFWKSADCVVIGPSPEGKDSVEIGVYKDGKMHRVAGCSLIGREKVLTGDVVEVKYLYATKTRHIVQPVMMRRRDDKKASDCTVDQLIINRDMA